MLLIFYQFNGFFQFLYYLVRVDSIPLAVIQSKNSQSVVVSGKMRVAEYVQRIYRSQTGISQKRSIRKPLHCAGAVVIRAKPCADVMQRSFRKITVCPDLNFRDKIHDFNIRGDIFRGLM